MDQNTQKTFEQFKQQQHDAQKIVQDLGGMNKGPLAKIWDKVIGLKDVMMDPSAHWQSKAIAIAALAYAVSPIDAIPDILPVVGLTDDVAVIMAAIAAVANMAQSDKK